MMRLKNQKPNEQSLFIRQLKKIKMYFKVKNDSETEKKLRELKVKIDAAEDLCRGIVKELGGEKHASNGDYLAGDIGAISFKNHFTQPPDKDLWRKVGESWRGLYLPKAKNKNGWEIISRCAKIKNDELNVLVGFPDGLVIGEGLTIYRRPGVSFGKVITINFPKGVKYTPNPDMIEIMESEFIKLQPKEELETELN